MKTNKVLLLFLLPLIGLTASCNQCSSVQPDPPSPVTLYFVDQQGQNLTSLESPSVHPDSIKFSLENEAFDYLFQSPDAGLNSTIYETYPVLYTKSNVNLLIHFSKEDTDTLSITYKVDKQECFTDYTYTSFSYNGQEVQPNPKTGYLKLTRHKEI